MLALVANSAFVQRNWVLRDYSADNTEAIFYFLHHFALPLKRLYRGLEI
jgi:hypothetical protein